MKFGKLHKETEHVICGECGGDRFQISLSFFISIIGFRCTTKGCKNFIPIEMVKPPDSPHLNNGGTPL